MKASPNSTSLPVNAKDRLGQQIAEVYESHLAMVKAKGEFPHAWTDRGLVTVAVVEIPIGGPIDIGRGEMTLLAGSGRHLAVADADGRITVADLCQLTCDRGVADGAPAAVEALDRLAHLCDLLGSLQAHGEDVSSELAQDVSRVIDDVERQLRELAEDTFTRAAG